MRLGLLHLGVLRLATTPIAIALLAFATALPASSALCQELSAGHKFIGASAGYSWYSPRGTRWGLITGRRIFLTGLRLEWVHKSAGSLALASTLEFPLALVARTKSQTEECWAAPEPNMSYCVEDYSSRLAVGTGILPGLKLFFNRSGHARFYTAGAVGWMMFNSDVPVDRAGRFNFALEYGVGVELLQGRNRTLTLGYKFYHISNADTWAYNPGLDGNILYVGLLKRR